MGTPGEGLGRCSHALIRGVPESLASGEGAGAGLPALDLAKAQREHGVLGGKLRQRLGLQLLELPPEESLPLGPLLGDTAVIQGDTALITRPWSPARRPEVSACGGLDSRGLRGEWGWEFSAPSPALVLRWMASARRSRTWGSGSWRRGTRTRRWTAQTCSSRVRPGCRPAWHGSGARARASGACFRAPTLNPRPPGSGREFFVGLSKWTNHRGAEIVADTFRVRSGTGEGGCWWGQPCRARALSPCLP